MNSIDSGEIAAIVTVVGGLATGFGAGDLVPLIGPAVQGLLAIISLMAGVYSWWSHREKNIAAATS